PDVLRQHHIRLVAQSQADVFAVARQFPAVDEDSAKIALCWHGESFLEIALTPSPSPSWRGEKYRSLVLKVPRPEGEGFRVRASCLQIHRKMVQKLDGMIFCASIFRDSHAELALRSLMHRRSRERDVDEIRLRLQRREIVIQQRDQ